MTTPPNRDVDSNEYPPVPGTPRREAAAPLERGGETGNEGGAEAVEAATPETLATVTERTMEQIDAITSDARTTLGELGRQEETARVEDAKAKAIDMVKRVASQVVEKGGVDAARLGDALDVIAEYTGEDPEKADFAALESAMLESISRAESERARISPQIAELGIKLNDEGVGAGAMGMLEQRQQMRARRDELARLVTRSQAVASAAAILRKASEKSADATSAEADVEASAPPAFDVEAARQARRMKDEDQLRWVKDRLDELNEKTARMIGAGNAEEYRTHLDVISSHEKNKRFLEARLGKGLAPSAQESESADVEGRIALSELPYDDSLRDLARASIAGARAAAAAQDRQEAVEPDPVHVEEAPAAPVAIERGPSPELTPLDAEIEGLRLAVLRGDTSQATMTRLYRLRQQRSGTAPEAIQPVAEQDEPLPAEPVIAEAVTASGQETGVVAATGAAPGQVAEVVTSVAAESVAAPDGEAFPGARRIEDQLKWIDERLAELREKEKRMIGEGDTEEYRTLRDNISVHEKNQRFLEVRLRAGMAAAAARQAAPASMLSGLAYDNSLEGIARESMARSEALAATQRLEDQLGWVDERIEVLRERVARLIGEGDSEEYRTLRDMISVHEQNKRFLEARLGRGTGADARGAAAAGEAVPRVAARVEASVPTAESGFLRDELRRVDDELEELNARTPRYIGDMGEEAEAHRAKLAAAEERKRAIEARIVQIPRNLDEIRRIDDQLAELREREKRLIGEGNTAAYAEHAKAVKELTDRRKALEEDLGQAVPDRSNEVTAPTAAAGGAEAVPPAPDAELVPGPEAPEAAPGPDAPEAREAADPLETTRRFIEDHVGRPFAEIDLFDLEGHVRESYARNVSEHARLEEELQGMSTGLRDRDARERIRERLVELEAFAGRDRDVLTALARLRSGNPDARAYIVRAEEDITSLSQAERIFYDVYGRPSEVVADLDALSERHEGWVKDAEDRLDTLNEEMAENERRLAADGLEAEREADLRRERDRLYDERLRLEAIIADGDAIVAAIEFIQDYREEHLKPWKEYQDGARPEVPPVHEQEAVLAPLRGACVDAMDRLESSIRKDQHGGAKTRRLARGLSNAFLGTSLEDRNVTEARAVVDEAVRELLGRTPDQAAASTDSVRDVVDRIAHARAGAPGIFGGRLGSDMMTNLNMDSTIAAELIAAVEAKVAYKEPLTRFAIEMSSDPAHDMQELFDRYVEGEYKAEIAHRQARLAREGRNAGLLTKLGQSFSRKGPAVQLGAAVLAGATVGVVALPFVGGAGVAAASLVPFASAILRMSRKGPAAPTRVSGIDWIPDARRSNAEFGRFGAELASYEQAVLRGNEAAATGDLERAKEAFEEARVAERLAALAGLEMAAQDVGRIHAARAHAQGRRATALLLAGGLALFGTGVFGMRGGAKKTAKPAPVATSTPTPGADRADATVVPHVEPAEAAPAAGDLTPEGFLLVDPGAGDAAARRGGERVEEPAAEPIDAEELPADVTEAPVAPVSAGQPLRTAAPVAAPTPAVRVAAEAQVTSSALPGWARGLTPEQVTASGTYVANIERALGISLDDPNGFGRLFPMSRFMDLDPALPLSETAAMRLPNGQTVEVSRSWRIIRVLMAQNPGWRPRTPEELAMPVSDFVKNRIAANGSSEMSVSLPAETPTQEGEVLATNQIPAPQPIRPYVTQRQANPVRTYQAGEMRNQPLDLRQPRTDAPPAPPTTQ